MEPENSNEFEALINPNIYQVFLFSCPANIPLNFAAHTWFVANKRGELSRWEVLFGKNRSKTCWGHLHLDFLPPFQGIF